MLAVVLPAGTQGPAGYWDLGGAPLAITTDLVPGTNSVSIELLDTVAVTGKGDQVVAWVTAGAVSKKFYNFNNSITFQGLTTDVANVEDNRITLQTAYALAASGDPANFKWNLSADFGNSPLAVPPAISLAFDAADSLVATAGTGTSTITGNFNTPAPGVLGDVTLASQGTIDVTGATTVRNLTLDGTPAAGTTAIKFNGPVTASSNLLITDVNAISVTQPLTAGGGLTLSASAGLGSGVTISSLLSANALTVTADDFIAVNAPLTGTGAGSAATINSQTTLTVNDDITFDGAIDLDGNSGVVLAAACDLASAIAGITVDSTSAGITAAGSATAGTSVAMKANTAIDLSAVLLAKTADVTLTSSSGSITSSGAVTALATAVKMTANLGITTSGKIDATTAATLTSTLGSIGVAALIQARDGLGGANSAVTLDAGQDVTTTGGAAIDADGAVRVTAGGGVDIGAAVTVHGFAAAAGVVDILGKTKAVTVQPASPITVADGSVAITAAAGALTIESLVSASTTIDLQAVQGVTLSNAVDLAAAIVAAGTASKVTITNAANPITIDAPISATGAAPGGAVAVSNSGGAIDVLDDVVADDALAITANLALSVGGAAASILLQSSRATIDLTSTTSTVALTKNLALALPGIGSGLDVAAGTLATVAIPVTAGGAIAVASPQRFTVERPMSALGGGITITAASGGVASILPTSTLTAKGQITVTGDGVAGVTVGTQVSSTMDGIELASAAGAVTILPATVFLAPSVLTGDIVIDSGATPVIGIDLVAGNDITVTAGMGPVFAPTTDFTALGDVTITTPGGDLDVTGSTIKAGGDVALTAAAGQLSVDMSTVTVGKSLTLIDFLGFMSVGPLTVPENIWIQSGGGWVAVAGQDITSLAGDISIKMTGGQLDVSAIDMSAKLGSITLESTAAGVTVGASPARVFAVDPAAGDISLKAATTVTIGQPLVAGADLTVTATTGPLLVPATLSATTGNVVLTSAGAVTTGAAVAAGAGISITSTAGGGVTTDVLLAAGDIVVTAAGGPGGVTTTAAVTSTGGDVTVTSAAGIEVQASVAALGDVILSGAVAVTTLATVAAGAGISITSTAGGDVTTDVLTAAGDIVLTSAGGPGDVTTTAAVTSTGGDVTLTSASAIEVQDDVTALGSVSLTAVAEVKTLAEIKAGAGITIKRTAGGGVTANALTAAGNIELQSFGGPGAVKTTALVNSTGGDVTLTSASAIEVQDDVTALGSVSLTAVAEVKTLAEINAGAGITIKSTAGGGVTTDVLTAGGDVLLLSSGGPGSIQATAGISSTAGGVTIDGAAGVQIDADVSAPQGTVALTAGTVISGVGGKAPITGLFIADALTASFSGVGPLLFTNTLNDVDTLSVSLPSGTGVSFTDVDDIAVAGATTASGAVAITAATGFMSVTGPVVAASGITLAAATKLTSSATATLTNTGAGNIDVSSTSSSVTLGAGVSAVSGDVTILAGGLGGATAAGGITATGVIDVSAPLDLVAVTGAITTTAGSVSLVAGGTGGVSVVGAVSAAGQVAVIANAGPVSVTGNTTSTLEGVTVTAAGAITLGTSGTTISAGGGLGLVTTDVVVTSASGTIAVAAAVNAVNGSIVIVTTKNVTFSGGSLLANLTYTAGPPSVGLVSLSGATGIDITSNPTIKCGRLEIGSGGGGAVTLTSALNDVDTLQAIVGGNLTYSQVLVPLSINDPDSGGVRSVQVQSTGGSVSLTATAGLRIVDGLSYATTLALVGRTTGTDRGVEFVPTSVGDNPSPPNLPHPFAFAGTLRDMIGYVNANTASTGAVPGTANTPMRVVFDEPGSPVATLGTIVLAGSAPLPAITKTITFDGKLPQAPGGLGGVVGIDGTGVVGNGLTLATGSLGSTLRNAAIHGFSVGAGVQLLSSDNTLHDLQVGVDRDGNPSANGIGIDVFGATADRNLIGVATAGSGQLGNVIANSLGTGIRIRGGADYTRIQGNTIGTDVSLAAMGNDGDGISIEGSLGTVIGSDTPGLGNVIVNNAGNGIGVQDVSGNLTSYGVQIIGNTIADNAFIGVRIAGGSRNLVGGTTLGAGNTIERNLDGIRLVPSIVSTASENVVIGNTIAENERYGIRIWRGFFNRVSANTVSYNGTSGIHLFETVATRTAPSNRVVGNTVTGNGATQTDGGIVIEGASGQVIGLTNKGVVSGNDASANRGGGIVVKGVSSRANQLVGNTVSTNAFNGILVQGAVATVVQGNVASGNIRAGIAVQDVIATRSSDGTVVVGNAVNGNEAGVRITGGAHARVGGTNLFERNHVFANVGNGIVVESSSATGAAAGTFIRGNRIGVDPGNAAAGNGGYGIHVTDATGTTIDFANIVTNNEAGGISVAGGINTTVGSASTGRGNMIRANAGDGVLVVEPVDPLKSTKNVSVIGNLIESNADYGVRCEGGRMAGIVVGRQSSISRPNGTENTIRGNGSGLRGVLVDGAAPVTVIGNNIVVIAGGKPIEVTNLATTPPVPSITSVTASAPGKVAQVDVRGTLDAGPGAPGRRFYIDVYAVDSGDEQAWVGRVLVTCNAAGQGTYRLIIRGSYAAMKFRATATAANGGISLIGSTSEFSAAVSP